jgi:hypothetical protein
VKSVCTDAEVSVNSKEENSSDFYPNYVQEFVLGIRMVLRNSDTHLLRKRTTGLQLASMSLEENLFNTFI